MAANPIPMPKDDTKVQIDADGKVTGLVTVKKAANGQIPCQRLPDKSSGY